LRPSLATDVPTNLVFVGAIAASVQVADSMASISRQGIVLSAARYIEQAILLLTPVVLVRTIDPGAFGEYRLFWLLVNTVALLFAFELPRSLLFFFVRLDAEGRRLYVGQTTLFLLAVTMIASVLIFFSLMPCPRP